MISPEERAKRIERLAELRREARVCHDASVTLMGTGAYVAAVFFQREAASLYERAGNIVIGLMRKDKPGYGSME